LLTCCKCDQAKPTCARCTHLKIPCVGGGQQRYKFKNQSFAIVRASSGGSSPERLQSLPSNEITILASTFSSALRIDDIRYDLSIYGTFFKDIPKRLGTNEALDASAAALTTALTSVYARHQTPEMFDKYAQALKVVRKSLNDPDKAEQTDTLLAIYLLIITQVWITECDFAG
jgi:hypothetical protein